MNSHTEASFIFFRISKFCFYHPVCIYYRKDPVAKNVKIPITRTTRQRLKPSTAINASPLYSSLPHVCQALALRRIIALRLQGFFLTFYILKTTIRTGFDFRIDLCIIFFITRFFHYIVSPKSYIFHHSAVEYPPDTYCLKTGSPSSCSLSGR